MAERAVSPEAAASQGDQAVVFLSYHRSDRPIVLRLAAELEAAGIAVRGDWDLEAAVRYEDVLGQWIEAAGMFVLIMTPESLASSECGKEIGLALRLGKKLAAVLLRQVDLKDVPPELRAINWVFLREEADLTRAARQLQEALEKDREWEKSHTSLLRRAIEWESTGRRPSAALRREDLGEAEQWLTRAGADPALVPRPAEIQRAYILFSRISETRRRRTVAGAVIAALLITFVLLGIAVRQRALAEANGQNAEREKIRGIEERGRQLLVAGDPEGALPFLAQAFSARKTGTGLGDDTGLRFMLARAVAPLDGRIATYRPRRGRVRKVALRPDERQVMAVTDDGALRLWNVSSPPAAKPVLAAGGVSEALYSPDGTRVVTLERERDRETDGENEASYRMSSSLIDTASGKVLANYGLDSARDPEEVATPQFSADGKVFFLTRAYSGDSTGYSVVDGTEIAGAIAPDSAALAQPRRPCGAQEGLSVGESADGRMLVTDQGRILLAAGCRWLGSLEGPLPLRQAVFSRDGSLILAAHRDVAILWRRARPQASLLRSVLNEGTAAVFADRAAPRALVARKTGIDLLDLQRARVVGVVPLATGQAAELIPLTARAIVRNPDGGVDLWDVAGQKLLAPLDFQKDEVSQSENVAAQWAPAVASGVLLIKQPGQWDITWTTGFDLVSLKTGKRLSFLQAPGYAFDAFALSRDGRWIFTSAIEGAHPHNWLNKPDDWSPFYLADLVAPLHAVVFSRDNAQVITLADDRRVHAWDRESGKVTLEIPARLEDVRSLSLSSQGRYLLASSSEQSEIVDLSGRASVGLIEGAASGDDWAFSPDERFAVTAGPDAAVRVYETATGRLLWLQRLPGVPASAVRWHPKDGKILVQSAGTTLLLNSRSEDRSPAEIAALVQAHQARRDL